MAYVKGQPFKPQFTDPATGLLMQSGTVEFYLAGGSTPTPFYTDSTGTSGGTSLTLDSGGKPPTDIYFDTNITYKLVVKNSAGTVLDTINPYIPSYERDTSSTLAALVSATDLQIGESYTVTDRAYGVFDVVLASTVTPNTYNIVQCTGVPTLALVLRTGGTLYARQWGAKFDNTNDDSGAINYAYQQLGGGNNAGKLVLDANNGQCRCDSTLLFNKTGVQVTGDGYVVINSHAASGFAIDFGLLPASSNMLSSHILENIGLVVVNTGVSGIRVRSNFSDYRNVSVFVKDNAAAWVLQGGTTGFGTGPYYNNFYNCFGNGTPVTGVSQTGWLFKSDPTSLNQVPNSNKWYGCGTSATDTAFDIDGGQGNSFYGCRMEGTRNTVVSINHATSQAYCNGNVFYSPYIEGLASANPDVLVTGANSAGNGMLYPFLTSIGSGSLFTNLNPGQGNFFLVQDGAAGGSRIETSDWQFISPAVGDYLRFKGPRIGVEFEDTNGGVVITQKNVSSVSAGSRAVSFTDGTTDLLEFGQTDLTYRTATGNKVKFDNTATAGQTSMLLWDVDNATLERVTVGAADSGGAGFKVLRIPN